MTCQYPPAEAAGAVDPGALACDYKSWAGVSVREVPRSIRLPADVDERLSRDVEITRGELQGMADQPT